MRLSAVVVALSSLLFALPAAAGARVTLGALQILNPRAVGQVPGAPVEVYMTVVNTSDTDDYIIDAYVPGARKAELHDSTASGKATMAPEVDEIAVPAHGKVELKPGGYRIIVFDLPGSIRPGDPVPMEIEFDMAGRANISPILTMRGAAAKTTSGQPTDTPTQ